MVEGFNDCVRPANLQGLSDDSVRVERPRGGGVRRPALLPAVAGLAYAHRGEARLDRPTPALFALLNVLGAREGSIQHQLSSDMGIDPSAMVKLINELEDAGLAKRRRRPGDRRAWEVSITPKGRRALTRARQLVVQVEDEVLGGLTAADRRQLLTLLRRALVSAPAQPPWSPEEEEGRSRPRRPSRRRPPAGRRATAL